MSVVYSGDVPSARAFHFRRHGRSRGDPPLNIYVMLMTVRARDLSRVGARRLTRVGATELTRVGAMALSVGWNYRVSVLRELRVSVQSH